MKSSYPISLFILLIIFLLSIIFGIGAGLAAILFYITIIVGFFYMLFSRYACKIKTKESQINFDYLIEREENITINLDEVKSITAKRGFYNLFNENTIGGLYVFPKYCYDLLIVEYENGEIKEVKINTILGGFRKLKFFIKGKSRNIILQGDF